LPKRGMGPIRREQICRAAATVISEHGFAGTTMRMVADEAGVSTGMLNHYFANRAEMLEHTLLYVSERMQTRVAAAIADIEPGERRLREFVRSQLPTDSEAVESWRVWIAAYGDSVRRDSLRHVIGGRLSSWYEIVDRALEGIVPARGKAPIPYSWQLDALIVGLVIQAIATETAITFSDIEPAIVTAIESYAGASASSRRARNGRRSAVARSV
jgi:AcrR family transcriptional regulator